MEVFVCLLAVLCLGISVTKGDIVKKCVSDCHGVPDGDYQDCKSCNVFVSCSNNNIYIRPCPRNLEWDDDKKRCVANSNTCHKLDFGVMSEDVKAARFMEETRRVNIPPQRHCNSTGTNCVADCTGKKDGDYQSCHGCDVYVSCVAGNRYDDRPCAPGGLVWDDKKKRCEWTSPTCKGCYTPGKPCRGTGPRCVSQCVGLPDGDYQSCLGCDVYLSCSNGLKYDKRPCAPGGTVWDDNRKRCEWYSNTCFHC